MKVAVDTNILVRAAVGDDEHQQKLASEILRESESVAVALPALCEFAWVLSRTYRISPAQVATSIRSLVGASNVECESEAVEAGLVMLDAGGDFADGVIAFEGRRLGGDVFVTFDKESAKLLQRSGARVSLPSAIDLPRTQ
ncbi:MAG TPA: type II toxin-antitoxin system VapC family toxin [Mesorhizobium sp.]